MTDTRQDTKPAGQHSYLQILKSTALIGASSIVNIGFGIIRMKAMAVLLGPSGVGLMALYGSVLDLAATLASVGIHASGVRQIAEANGSGDAATIGRTAVVLKWVSIILGLLGAALLVVLAVPISKLTFGSHEQAFGVALLAVAVFLRVASGAQGALIQGMRRISDFARMTIIGALLSTVVTIPLVYFFGQDGIVPSLVFMAFATIAMSWWYSRKIEIETPSIGVRDMRHEVAALLKLGVAFMASGLLTMGAAYVIRIVVLHEEGFDAAGFYQAAWVVGGLYVGFILQAMGTDFYPRLTGVANDNAACNRLVNEQAEISILLAAPGVIATLTLAPLVVAVFYSAEFHPAISLLRWVCLGMTLRVVAWPMGFIVLAKGAQRIFLWTEIAATVVHVGLAWLLVVLFGLDGAGAAFFGLYVWHSLLIYVVVRQLSGFRWSAENRKLGLIFLPATGAVFCSFLVLPDWQATTLGLIAAFVTGVYSLRKLTTLLPVEAFPRPLQPWLTRLTFRGRGVPANMPEQGP